MNTSDSRPGTQVIAERLKVSKRKDGGVCVFRLGGSVDGRDCHVNRDIWSPVAVKIQRRGRGADGKGRTAGHKSNPGVPGTIDSGTDVQVSGWNWKTSAPLKAENAMLPAALPSA